MPVILDHRALEATLPDVARAMVALVVSPGVSDGQGLKNATD